MPSVEAFIFVTVEIAFSAYGCGTIAAKVATETAATTTAAVAASAAAAATTSYHSTISVLVHSML